MLTVVHNAAAVLWQGVAKRTHVSVTLKGPRTWAREGIDSQMARPEFAYFFRVGFNVPVVCLVFTLHSRDIIQSWVISALTNIATYKCGDIWWRCSNTCLLLPCQPTFLRSVITLIHVSGTFVACFVILRTHVLGYSNWLSCSRHTADAAGLAKDRPDRVTPLLRTFIVVAVFSQLQVTLDVFQVDNIWVVVRAQCFSSHSSSPVVHPRVSSYILFLPHRAWNEYKRIHLRSKIS